jgi:hypothetical protein
MGSKIMTDVLLDEGPDEDWVTVDATYFNTTASVFNFGGNADPGSEDTYRRALAHTSESDALIINYKNDYPGGVRINNVTSFNNQEGLALSGIREITGERNTGSIEPEETFEHKLLIRGEITIQQAGYPSPIATQSPLISLQLTLNNLQNQISALTTQVAELQAKLGIR